ncbi:MAG TPA: alkaline phosphatase family protein [Pyrinomonadaceae bacterium]|nr:alkaline phosphatase family protein [Pyrinomonadaceae bacterium]
MPANIKHLVVLMMENRSFDHALGFLKSPTYAIDGLDGTETNPDIDGVEVRVSQDAQYQGDLKDDPGHDFKSVNEQIFENSQGTGTPTMRGFVKAYQAKTNNVARSHNIMRCFDPSRLPALKTLAQEYALCDRWFASVPGPTLPNRAFAFAATSLGRVNMNPNFLGLKTIFEKLDANNVSSKIYFTDMSMGQAVKFIQLNARKFLFFFDDFLKDAKKNKLPAYSFIEPRFNDRSTPTNVVLPSDQHPDHNVLEGDNLIKKVYEAIRSNQAGWESTLLVITYDEHGGLPDHVPPPATVDPGDQPANTLEFDFKRLGIRVPAVLVSPFIPPRTIVHTKFDHTSIIATARKLFIADFPNSFLTERDRNANTFENVLSLSAPRTDKVKIPKPASTPTGLALGSTPIPVSNTSAPTANEPLNDFQQAMVDRVLNFQMNTRLQAVKDVKFSVSAIATELDAAQYLEKIRKAIAKSRSGGKKKTSSTAKAKKPAGKKPGKKK